MQHSSVWMTTRPQCTYNHPFVRVLMCESRPDMPSLRPATRKSHVLLWIPGTGSGAPSDVLRVKLCASGCGALDFSLQITVCGAAKCTRSIIKMLNSYTKRCRREEDRRFVKKVFGARRVLQTANYVFQDHRKLCR